MPIRISKIAKELNVGVSTAAEFLRKHDIEVDETTDDNNDVFIFSQDPEVNGEIFTAPQDFTAESVPEEMIVMLKAVGDAVVQSAVIYLSENGAAAESSVGTRAAAENETVV